MNGRKKWVDKFGSVKIGCYINIINKK